MTSSLRWLRRRGPIVVLLTWVVAIVTLVVAPAPATSYPAVASFVVPSGANTVGPGSANEAITLAGIYAQLIPKDDALLKSATTDLGITRDELVKNLTVTIAAGSSLIVLRLEADTRQRSLLGLNDIAIALIAGVSSAIPAGSIVQVAAPVIDVNTSGLSHTERLLFGISLGLVLGIIIAVAWGRRDRRVDTPEALRHILGTPVTPLKEVSEWEARSLIQRWLATSERGSKSVAILTCTSYVRDPARWLEANFSLIGSPGNFGVVSVALDSGAVDESTSQPKLLFGGPAGSDTALAATLLTDVVVLAITAETPLRDVEAAYRVLAQHAVVPKWGLLVSRAAVRAEARRARENARQARRITAAEAAGSTAQVEVEPAEVVDLLVTEVPEIAAAPTVAPAVVAAAVVEAKSVEARPVEARPTEAEPAATAPVVAAVAEPESVDESADEAALTKDTDAAEEVASDEVTPDTDTDSDTDSDTNSDDDPGTPQAEATESADDEHADDETAAAETEAVESAEVESEAASGPSDNTDEAGAEVAEGDPTDTEATVVSADSGQSESERAEWAQWAERARAKWARWAEQGESARAEGESDEVDGEVKTDAAATANGQSAGDKREANGNGANGHNGNGSAGNGSAGNGSAGNGSAANGGGPREVDLSGHHNGNGHKGSETAAKT